MFFHGIDYMYLKKQYPFLNPDSNISSKKSKQLKDRQHLVERFGYEPVHLLESTEKYPVKTCIKECLSFGEIVLAFGQVTEPLLQLSEHEIGVSYLDVRSCRYIFSRKKLHQEIRNLGFKQPIFYVK